MKVLENGWAESSLEKLTLLIKDGSHGTHADVADGVPFLSAKDVRDGTLEIPNDCRRISDAEYTAIHKSYEIEANDILLTIVGSIGRCYLMTGTEPHFSIQRSVAVIRPDGVRPEYLYHFFRSDAFQTNLKDFTNASAQGGVYLGALAKCSVNYPIAKSEQTKIAEILSTVDRGIEQTEALIVKQQRIKTGLMQDLLTRGIDEHGNLRSELTHEFKDSPLGRIPVEWEVGSFDNYVINDAGIKPGPFGSSLTKDMYVEAGYRVYGQEQVIGGTLDIGDYFITGRKYSEMGGFAVKEGDILISLVGTIGHVLIVPHRYHPGVINPRLLRFRPDTRHCVPQFLKVLLLSQPVRLQLDTFATGGTMPVLSGGIIRKLRVVILGLNEQKRIIQMIAGSEAALLSSSTHLTKLRSLKTALMQDLLTGKKRVTPLLESEKEATA